MITRSTTGSGVTRKGLPTWASLLTSLLISLFFLQALRLYFVQVYLVVWAALFSDPIDVSGLLVAVLMLLSFLAPLLLPLLGRLTSMGRIALVSAIGVAVVRVFLSAGLSFEAETVASSLVVAFYCLFLPSYFQHYQSQDSQRGGKGYLVAGFILALAYDMAIRALGTTVDLSLRPEWLLVQVVLSGIAIVAAFVSYDDSIFPRENNQDKQSPWWAGVLILSGFGGLLFLEYNLFAHANTIARWVHVDYDLLAILMPLATVIGLLIPRVKRLQTAAAAIVQNLLILLAVGAFLWVDGWLSAALLLIAQIAIILDLRLLFAFVASRSFTRSKSTIVAIALTLSLFLAFILVLILTFSFAYAYTVDVFRGTEPVSFFVAAIVLGITASLATWRAAEPEEIGADIRWAKGSLAAIPIIVAVIALGLQPSLSPQPKPGETITVMTYNLHQAFGMDNKLDLEEVLATITEADPDIVGFQEADAGRVPSLSIDEVLWLARRLNMHSAYGPSWGNTYGVAVLSKYPILDHQRYLLTSHEQQRACLETKIDVSGETLSFFSVHLGLNTPERERQLDEVLAYTAAASPPIVLVGDFNATPDSHEISRVLERFENSFALAGEGSGYTSPADGPYQTIDYVFVSPDIRVLSARVISSLASDHLPVVSRIDMGSP